MFATRLIFTSVLAIGLLTWAARLPASDLRGTLQGADSLTVTPRADPPRYRAAYWNFPNGVLDPINTARANVEWDVGVVLTGPGVTESAQPVSVRVEGGRCRPGTIVVSPGTTLQIENADILGHELYAVRPNSTERVIPAELTTPRSRRQVSFQAPGTYEIRDVRQPSFRCWAVVGAGQGRVLLNNATGAFAATGLADGEYTVKAYFEGAERGSATVTIRGRDEQAQLTVSSGGAAAPAGGNAPANGANAPANAGRDDEDRGRRRRDRREE